MPFSKYRHVVFMGLQNTFVYRWNFLMRILFGLIPLTGTFYLWKAIIPAGQVAGYTFSQMISYFVALLVLDSLASPTEDDFQIASDIREGAINQFLLRPINYLGYRFSLFCSCRFIYTLTTILPVIMVLICMRKFLVFPDQPLVWFMSAVAVVQSAILQFLMAYTFALMAFWILEVAAPIFIIYSLEFLMGGHAFPLDLLPAQYQTLLMWTPFPYEYWFPLGVYFGRFTTDQLVSGFCLQTGWIVMFWMIARGVWNRGIRTYTAVGG